MASRARPKPPFVKIGTVARMMGVKLITVRQMLQTGALPPGIVIGKGKRRPHRLWRRTEIEAFIVGAQAVPA